MTRDLNQPNSSEMVSPDKSRCRMSTVKVSTRTQHGGLAERTGLLYSSLMSSLTRFSSTPTGTSIPSISSPASMMLMTLLLFMEVTNTTTTRAPTSSGWDQISLFMISCLTESTSTDCTFSVKHLHRKRTIMRLPMKRLISGVKSWVSQMLQDIKTIDTSW